MREREYHALVAELTWVVLGVGVFGAMSWTVSALAPLTLLWLSLGIVGSGALLGLPFGLRYHVLLRRELSRVGPLPARWFVQPIKFHERLDEGALARIGPAFFLGALGFGLMMLGCTLATMTLFTHFS